MDVKVEFWGTGGHHTVAPRYYDKGDVAAIPGIGDFIEVPFDGEPTQKPALFVVKERVFKLLGTRTKIDVHCERVAP